MIEAEQNQEDDFISEPLPDPDSSDASRSRLGRRSGGERRVGPDRRKGQEDTDFPDRRADGRRDPIDRRLYDRRPGDIY